MLRRLLLGCGVLAVAVTGCSSGGRPADTLPEATAAPATTTTTAAELPPLGPADLPMPAEARTQDPAGVEAFVRYYLALINRTSTVMDAAPLREFSDGCEDCDRIAQNTETDAAAGLAYRGGEVTITSVAPASISGPTGEVNFRVDQALLTVVDASGQVLQDQTTQPLTGLTSAATVRWDTGHHTWLMTQLTVG